MRKLIFRKRSIVFMPVAVAIMAIIISGGFDCRASETGCGGDAWAG